MITQRKPRRNAPHEWFKLPSGYSSLSPPMYPLILYAFPANKRVLCFITFCLHGNSFLQSWRARALSLTIGLVARIQYSNCGDPTSISGQERKPHFKPLQVKATQDHIWCWNPGIQGKPWASPSCGLRPLTFAPAFFFSLSISLSFQDPQGIISTLRMAEESPGPCRSK